MTPQEAFAAMTPDQQRTYQAMWTDTENRVIDRMPARSKNFEVHHAVIHARGLFLGAMMSGEDAAACQRIAMGEEF